MINILLCHSQCKECHRSHCKILMEQTIISVENAGKYYQSTHLINSSHESCSSIKCKKKYIAVKKIPHSIHTEFLMCPLYSSRFPKLGLNINEISHATRRSMLLRWNCFCASLQVWCNTQSFKNKRNAPASLYIQDVKTNKMSVSTAMSVSYITLFAELKCMWTYL